MVDTVQQPPVRLILLGGFEVSHRAETIPVPPSAHRVVGYVAIQERPVLRHQLASALWPDEELERSWSLLRSSLWRLRQLPVPILETVGAHIAVSPGIVVDVREFTDACRRIVSGGGVFDPFVVQQLARAGQLLPDLDEDWVTVARERFQQLRLHALERLCEESTAHGDFGQAIEAGLAAVADDPLRESAHRALIRLYIAEGNRSQALRQFERYRSLMEEELDLEPSRDIAELISGVRTH